MLNNFWAQPTKSNARVNTEWGKRENDTDTLGYKYVFMPITTSDRDKCDVEQK